MRKANCPIASFYARFKSKDDLLPHLYDRYSARVGPKLNAKLAAIDFHKIKLRHAVEIGVDLMLDMYESDKWLMREVALFARRNPGAIDDGTRRERAGMHTGAATLFAVFKADIKHMDPVRAAEVGIFIVASVARESILFGAAPHATATALSTAQQRSTLVHTLFSFLTTPCASPHLCCSPSSRRSQS